MDGNVDGSIAVEFTDHCAEGEAAVTGGTYSALVSACANVSEVALSLPLQQPRRAVRAGTSPGPMLASGP